MVDRFPVEAGHIMLFARSIGDTNQVYYDEDYAKKSEAGGIIAPPTFVQASAQWEEGYSLRPTIGQPWFGSGKEPTGVKREPGGGGGGGLHAEQHYEYHRHLRPGDVLHSVNKPGESWERESKRAGKLMFSESITEYYDQNNELVITARSVGVRTERPVDQG
jgi:N-terminal half of MaoC dehydratase